MKKVLIIMFLISLSNFSNTLVIAHRGASGKYPENTKKAFEYAKGYSNYLEQDLQLTKDNQLIVFHDRVLDNVTNVKKVYPKSRARKDGKYYVIDFTLEELMRLQVTNRYFIFSIIKLKEFSNRKYNPNEIYQISSFQEVLDLVEDYNNMHNKKLGIYPELKDVWFYKQEGRDITIELFNMLKKYSYEKKQDQIFIQSYDSQELRRIKNEINSKFGTNYKLVQLVPKRKKGDIKVFEDNKVKVYDYSYYYTKEGLDKIREYADVLGPDKSLIYGNKEKEEYYKYAKEIGFLVHVYTFNLERVSKGFKNYNEEVIYYRDMLGIDAYFTDYPDIKL